MAYDVKSFRAWATYYDVAQELPPKEQGMFYRAIFEYMFAGQDIESELPKIARICFKSIKPNLKRSKSNARKEDEPCGIGEESVRGTLHRFDTKNALNSNSNSNSNSKGNDGGSERWKTAPPVCEECGETAYRNQQIGAWVCPSCNRRLA